MSGVSYMFANSDSELNWLDDVREILFGALIPPAADTKEVRP